MQSPEGNMPQPSPGSPDPQAQGGDPASALAEGISHLGDGTQALLQGLTQSGAPKEIVQLAQTAADAISQLQQAMSGGAPDQSAAPQGQDQSGSAQELTNA